MPRTLSTALFQYSIYLSKSNKFVDVRFLIKTISALITMGIVYMRKKKKDLWLGKLESVR